MTQHTSTEPGAIERTVLTIDLRGTAMTVTQLVDGHGTPLHVEFTYKPRDLTELGRGQRYVPLITHTVDLTAAEFDRFALRLLTARDWLRGRGGMGRTPDEVLCVEVTAPNRPTLLVNPEGHDYAREVAALPMDCVCA